jgi:hypothetical protein
LRLLLTYSKLILIIALIACQEIIDLDINDNANLVTVEAFISAADSSSEVILSRTVGFSSADLNPGLTGAEVRLRGADNSSYIYIDAGNGRYTSSRLQLVTATPYVLEIVLDNGDTIISASETALDAPQIDSISYNSILLPDPDFPRLEVTIYYPVIYLNDPGNESNRYLFQLYKNDTLYSSSDDLVLLDDRFINGNRFSNEFPQFIYELSDTIKIDLSAISRSTFEYLEQFKKQTAQLSSNLLTTPSGLTGNLRYTNKSEAVLGYFGILSTSTDVKIIE